jgi:hypothetical protein
MSDIALLITGVITTGQVPPPNLLGQPVIQLDNGVERSIQGSLSDVVPTTEVTPPEFMQSHGTSEVACRVIAPENVTNKVLLASTLLPHFPAATEDFSSMNSLESYPRIADKPPVRRQQRGNNRPMANVRFYSSPGLPTIGFGSRGLSVRVLQKLLQSNGYPIQVDGMFGALTEAAVKAFQNQRNLAVDGIVGQNTWLELTE